MSLILWLPYQLGAGTRVDEAITNAPDSLG